VTRSSDVDDQAPVAVAVEWRRTVAVNVDSFFYVAKAAVPYLQNSGAIINAASINGLRGDKS
jgi:NAD(P)-dependent dehydrogenase (short-subunit alcohol dehydrogenase family)